MSRSTLSQTTTPSATRRLDAHAVTSACGAVAMTARARTRVGTEDGHENRRASLVLAVAHGRMASWPHGLI